MKIFDELGINPVLLAAQVVNFAILLYLLNRFLYKPILKVLNERKATVARSLKDAEEIEKRLEETTAQQQKILDKARLEASALITEAKKESKDLSEKMLAETKGSVEEMMKRNREQLTLEKEQMLLEAKKDLAELVVETTLKVSGKAADSKDNRKLVEETVKEVI